MRHPRPAGTIAIRHRGRPAKDMLRQLPNLLIDIVLLGERVVHPVADVLLHLVVGEVADGELAIDAVALRGADDAARHHDRHVADPVHVRVEPVRFDFFRCEGGGERLGRGVDHVLSYAYGLAQDGAETDAGED